VSDPAGLALSAVEGDAVRGPAVATRRPRPRKSVLLGRRFSSSRPRKTRRLDTPFTLFFWRSRYALWRSRYALWRSRYALWRSRYALWRSRYALT
jgi:hypothetical protein